MRTLTKMLVVVDTRKESSIALNRAVLIAKATDTPIIALAPNPHANEASRARLDAMLQPHIDAGLEISGSEQWHNSAVETIIHVRQMERCSLVVKASKEAKGIGSIVSTPEDWALLRQCRVPVLLVKNTASWMGQKILAAVDACPNDSNHEILNNVIMEYAANISGLAEAECHMGSAHPGMMLAGEETEEQTQSLYQNNCLSLADKYDIDSQAIHVDEGPAEVFIPELSKTLGASLIVMGTVANTSLKGALLGNTAEQILQHVECDVLTVKPRDLMDPLENVIR
ncbi:universal stress protein [Sansalvadorimonas verongulae]|uniref:universal stress protein n=1 Tax=Sansalvadorimonas verongulae TaxID=2172824 RepID=UPI0012BC17DA|nr:universal stress protein [Sansalvadorimonas verongulae]MTI12547.1 universal stress protein UspA [Sansalvadorimonas verongulae]